VSKEKTENLSNLQLNCWLAEHLFKFEWWRSSLSGNRALLPPNNIPDWFHEKADMSEDTCYDHPSHVPNYCESEKDVWLVINELARKGIYLFINSHNNLVIPYQTVESVYDGKNIKFLTFGSYGETLPRSICEAAKEGLEVVNTLLFQKENVAPKLDTKFLKKIIE